MIREKLRAIVEGVNLHERLIPADPERGTKAETVMSERSIHYSNLNLVDPVTGFPTKINWSYLEDGTKVRISKRSGAIIPKPDNRRKGSLSLMTSSEESDTINEKDVWAKTYEEPLTTKWEDMRLALLEKEKKLGGGEES